MRVAIATDIFRPQLSGVADSIDALTAALVAAGHAVRAYAPRVGGAEADPNVRRLVSVSVPGSGGGLAVVMPFGALRDLRRFRPDVIHVHTFAAVGLLAVYASRRLGVPLVGTDHTFPADYLHYLKLDFAAARRWSKRMAAWFYDRCDLVTAPSRILIDELRRSGMESDATVISNPIASDRFRPLERRDALKRKLGIGPEAVVLFGRIAVEKNLDMTIDVFAGVAERRRVELVVIGDGPERPAFEQRMAERNLGDRCRMLGELHGEPLNEAINACDVFMTTSKSETQSMTMLQAAAAGLPVVAIRAGGLPEYVVDGQTGYVIDEDNRDRFVTRIIGLIDDRGLARQMGKKGRQLTMRFTPDAVAAKFVDVYQKAIARQRVEAEERLA